jgi:hypothetical protein
LLPGLRGEHGLHLRDNCVAELIDNTQHPFIIQLYQLARHFGAPERSFSYEDDEDF